jgi:hypothetical protein
MCVITVEAASRLDHGGLRGERWMNLGKARRKVFGSEPSAHVSSLYQIAVLVRTPVAIELPGLPNLFDLIQI